MTVPRERTFLMVKPDGVTRGLIGAIITRFERRGFKLVAMKFVQAERAVIERHYDEHKDKPFFRALIEYTLSGPVVPMVWEGKSIVALSRMMLGETTPAKSNPGTIRGDYGIESGRYGPQSLKTEAHTHPRNVIHGSDNVETAKREIGIWFTDKEIAKWTRSGEEWLYE